MNKVYKVVWSDAANAWVAVSEISTAHGKSKSSKTIAVAVAAVGMMLSSAAVQAAGLTWGTGAVAADDEAIAMGNDSDAKTNYTIVLGSGAKNKSNGESAVVIGHGAEATSDANPNTAKNTMGQQVVVGEASVANSQSVALGAQVYATGQSSIAIGGDDLGNNDSKTSAGKYSGAQDWRNYAGQPITVEGVSTKDASDPAIGFTSTTASGRGSVAIGHMSQSTGKASLAFGADSHAEADGAIAAGMASQAKGSAAVAIGVGAEAPKAHATAIGLKAKANGGNAFAAGSNAKADGENSIALGYGASTETNSATYPRIASQPDKTMNNIAIGKTARSGGLQTIAFGAESVASKTQSIAFGFDAQATGDQSVALGANTRSTGDSSVAIGGDDLDSVASTTQRVTSPSADNDAYNDTALAKKYRELTGQNLVDFTPGNRYIGTSTGQAGVAVGVSAKAADLATAVGTKSHATGDYSAALGVGANATLANAVALGAGSTTATNATDVSSATIGAITYGGGTSPFAGSGNVVAGDQVSVGAAGFERQIKHVAPGAITDTSTDAINGSQLFYVAKGLQEQITAAGGNGIHFYHVNGASTDNNYNNDGATGNKALAAGINAKAAGASSVAVGSAEVAAKSVVGQSNSEGAVAIGDSAYAAGRQAVTLGASRAEEEQAVAIGSNARSSGKASTAIGAAAVASKENSISIGSSANAAGNNSVAIGADSSTVAAGSVALGYGSQATRAAIDATNVQANAAPTVANNQVYALASASNTDQNNIRATVKGELGAVSVGTQSGTRQIINVAAGTEDSDAVNVAQLKAVANQIAASSSSAATHYYSVKGSGSTDGNYNNDGATGDKSMAAGVNASAKTSNSIAIGTNASVDVGTATTESGTVTGVGSVAVGADSAAKGTNAAAFGQKAEAFGQNSLAAGQDSHATGKSSVALGDGAKGSEDSATAVGVYTKATGAGATAIGSSAEANTWGATALGLGAKAITNSSTTAIGRAAEASGSSATAVGAVASATGNNAVAVGNNSTAAGSSSFAAGHGAEAGAVNSVSIGLNAGKGASNNTRTIAIGDSAAINSNGNNNVAVGTQAMNGYVGNASIGIGEQAGLESKGQHNTVIGWTAARHLDGDDNIAIGTRANDATAAAPRTVANTVALGSDTKATVNGAVAVGNKSVASTAAGVEGADPLNAVTAKNNATWTSTEAAVSVGDVANNITRQITGVAAGKEDTDVVNVAQLKAVASQITTQAVAITPLTVANDGKVTPPAAADAGKLATAGDIANAINNSGFQATAGGRLASGTTATATTVKPGQKVTFAAGNGLTVKQEVNATNGDQTYTYALDAQTVVQNAQTPVVYTDANGNKVYKHTDGNFYTQPNGGGTQVAAGNVIASMQDASGNTTAPTTLANVKGNLADTSNATGNPSGNDRATLAAGNKGNNAATVNDVLNAGFTVQGNGADKDFVTHGDTINFVNGQGTVANVTSTNGVTEVKFDTPLSYADAAGNNTTTPSNAINLVGSDPSKPVTLGNVAEGVKDTDAVNVAQLNAAKTKVQAADNSPVTVTGTGSSTDPYKVGVNTVTLAPATGTDTGKVAAPATGDAGKLVTAGDIANAINNSGFKATAGGNTTGAAPTEQLIKAGDTLTLKAGNGLTVAQNGSEFTYALNAQQIAQDAQTPVVYTQADGSKVYKHTDGNFYTQPNGAGTQVGTGDVIASMNGGDNSTTNPTTLANVKSNLADAASALSNPANNSRADLAGKGNNAATVNDVLNAGFTVQGNGTASDFVTHGDTVNFVNGQGTVANVKTTNGVTEVKFDTPLSYADAAGNNTGTPSNAVNLVGDTAGSPVTLGNVADGVKDTDAVNVKQLKDSQTKVVKGTNIASVDHDAATNTYTVNAKGSETSGVDDETVVTATPDATTNVTSYKVGLADKVKDDIKKGVDAKDAVDNKGLTFTADSGDTGVKKLGDSVAIKGDSNIVTSADASGINMRLADVLNIGPSTGGNPVTINGNTGTIGGLTNKTWNPNSITSGQAATEDQLKLVADQAGQKGSFTLTAQGANGSTVGDGSTVDLNNTDGNIVVSKESSNNNVTFNLAKDLKADSLTINNGGPVINGDGINMGGKKITNVADGDVTATSKDAVNGSQLYAVQQEAQKRNTVKAGNNVTVTEAPNANGGTEYTINAEKSVVGGVNDETVVTATNDPTTNTTTYNVGLADKVKDDIKKGADAADAVNNKGLTFKGDSGDTGVKKLGDEVSITGDSNITTKADGNGVQVSLNRDVDVDSVKAGDSTLNNDGLTINGGPSVTKTGIDAADKKVTNVANGDVTATSKDAVNGSQLHQHGDGVKNIIGGNTTYDPNTGSYTNNDIGGTGQSTIDDAIRHINSTANAGWNLQTNGGATEKVGSGETVNFKNGNNISITNTGKEITIATNPDLTADSLTINNGGPVINGNGINMGDKKITNVADGDISDTSKDAVNGSQLHATNQNVANNTANIAKGFNFGDGNTANNYQLGDTISVKGDNNVTSTTVNGGVQLGLNQNLSLTSVTTGNTKMDNNGLTINGGPSVTTNGVDAGGKKITNVAAGEADTDAVNVGQLNQKLGAIAGANTAHVAALEQKINNVEDEADAGTASAMATAGLPQAYLPGKSMIAVGASNYRGKTGYAVGFSAITDGGNWIIKGTASGNSKGRFGASIGAGYQW